LKPADLGPEIRRLARLGRERNFPLHRFERSLSALSRRMSRGEVLRQLFLDWANLTLDEESAEDLWVDVERRFRAMRAKLRTPLGLPTVLLFELHSRTGRIVEPRVVSERDLEILRVNAITDPLTGLYNRRFLLEHLDREISRAGRSGGVLSVVMIDLKGFKAINDRFGHPIGDSALVRTARIIRGSLRTIDAGCRWGGDEFVLVLPNTGLLAAFTAAERVRHGIAAGALPRTTGVELGLHYGIACFPADGRTVDFLLKIADLRLYQCREQSRFVGKEQRRHPRFLPQDMALQIQWGKASGTRTAPIVDVGGGGLSFQVSRPDKWPARWKAMILQRYAPDRYPVRLRTLHQDRLPDGGQRVGCAYA
jgi:diguanylate cyclase (GGDEF)-like protein